MSRPSFKRIWPALSAAILTVALALIAYTQDQPVGPELAVQKVKDDLYVISFAKGVGGGNVIVYLTDEGVILVDDMFARNAAEILQKVETLTDKPIRYVLNTHQHEDHAGGNVNMPASTEIIAHRNVRKNLLALKAPWLPRVTFADEMTVILGGKEVIARHFGRGHTNGDSVIYFPAAKVVHTGDLFLTYPPAPFIDYAQGGSAVEWTGCLDEILKLDFDVAVPGHGPLSDRSGILKFKSNFETMRSRISGMIHEGKGKEDVSKTLAADFGWAPNGLALQQVDAFIAEVK